MFLMTNNKDSEFKDDTSKDEFEKEDCDDNDNNEEEDDNDKEEEWMRNLYCMIEFFLHFEFDKVEVNA